MLASEQKKILRTNLLNKRLRLNSSQVEKYSEIILNALSIHVDWSKFKILHIYLPIKKYNEVDTSRFIDFIRQNHPDIKIEIAPSLSKSKDISEGNDYDLAVVPVLGFDRRGYRLGYGGGYYDKFLAKNTCTQIIGLAYSFSEIDKMPDEPHDQKMQTIITEKEIISVS